MMNKKGYIRTIEAVIAIVVILIFTYSVTPKYIPETGPVPYSVEVAQKTILETLVQNADSRERILSPGLLNGASKFEPENVEEIAGSYNLEADVPPGYNYAIAVCVDTACISDRIRNVEKSVYMDDIMVTSGEVTRIVRIWMWPKD